MKGNCYGIFPCRLSAGGALRCNSLTRLGYVYMFGRMEIKSAIDSFAALSQETRLEAFRLLVHHEPEGLAAGEIARQLAVPHNTMSAHLAVLARAGWVSSRRQSRSIIYRADLAHMQDVLRFLVRDCCGGHPEICEPSLTLPGACSTINAERKTP
ncbi:ArsR/SmtB family transcription factor [Halopseudomonas bauzanensis]|nr:helix-turn-helix transcriptional regulator [Halopseudomonas bauzanensis]